MTFLQVYPHWEEAKFLTRPNRFTMQLQLKGKEISAYVPNTGRMQEFLVPGQSFYLTPVKTPKFNFKVIGTEYQGNYVFLDTVMINGIFQKLMEKKAFPDLKFKSRLQREVSYLNGRLDFAEVKDGRITSLLEIKSCTLCHNGVAMFPDAPTARGRKHLEILEKASENGIGSYLIYLITNSSARTFIPNYHTDFDYCTVFLRNSLLKYKAYSLDFTDPVTFNSANIRPVEIDKEKIEHNCLNRGDYLLILFNREEQEFEIGKLGMRKFARGFYTYVGSAMRSLDSRIGRHRSKVKKRHWHIDYIVPYYLDIKDVTIIRSDHNSEVDIVERLERIACNSIPGFGSSDSERNSHLFYFRDDPRKDPDFNRIILDFMTDR